MKCVRSPSPWRSVLNSFEIPILYHVVVQRGVVQSELMMPCLEGVARQDTKRGEERDGKVYFKTQFFYAT